MKTGTAAAPIAAKPATAPSAQPTGAAPAPAVSALGAGGPRSHLRRLRQLPGSGSPGSGRRSGRRPRAPPQGSGLPPVNFGFLITALLCGGLMGWALQRGRFCMNSAFRDTIFIKEFVTFRAFLLALLVSIIGANSC